MAQTRGAHFGGDAPAELADGELEDEGPDEGEDGLGGADGLLLRLDVEDADDHEDDGHASGAPEVNDPAADVGHDGEPGDESADEGEGCAAEVQSVIVGRG